MPKILFRQFAEGLFSVDYLINFEPLEIQSFPEENRAHQRSLQPLRKLIQQKEDLVGLDLAEGQNVLNERGRITKHKNKRVKFDLAQQRLRELFGVLFEEVVAAQQRVKRNDQAQTEWNNRQIKVKSPREAEDQNALHFRVVEVEVLLGHRHPVAQPAVRTTLPDEYEEQKRKCEEDVQFEQE